MDLRDKSVVILGGSGLVGAAVARKLLEHGPRRIVLVALYEEEVASTANELRPEAGKTEIICEWGNVFLPADAAKLGHSAMLADDGKRRRVVADLLDDFSDDILERSFLHQLFTRFAPDAVVDCINTATAFAYQDVFASARDLLKAASAHEVTRSMIERHVLTLTMPQLIRHMQIAVESMKRTSVQSYVKIGTSGTGGMGLNIPYTHSEERPSRTLLTKSAVAGAQSLLLFLVARTPGAPAAKEIKPTTAIAWRKIAYGPIRRAGKDIALFDCPAPLSMADAFTDSPQWVDLGRPVESVYIDVGENGVFARDEFETVTALGQMEFITPEEVADYVVMELQGRATGRDIVAALDASTAGPTYSAGALRSIALDRLDVLQEVHGTRSVAFEMLGPPRLTKLLYEAYLWSLLRPSVRALAESTPAELAAHAEALVADDQEIRSLIVSIGLPILLQDGNLYRGQTVLLPPDGGDLDRLVARGWVDLREANCEVWTRRAARVLEQAGTRQIGTGSLVDWHAIEPDDAIAPARFAKWIFRYEDDGERIKR
jgi:NAD(P)-dependent dehydrogenase (short-subunit alcohol dehydrogenase family)